MGSSNLRLTLLTTLFLKVPICYKWGKYFHLQTMPWGPLSVVQMKTPEESNDGPILWIRPGEQLVPTAESKTPLKRKRQVNEYLRSFSAITS